MGQGHAAEGGGDGQLADRYQADDQQGDPAPGDHHAGQRDRDGDLQHRLVPSLAGHDGRQRVIDDLRGGVQQVQQVADDPEAGLDQGDPAPGRGLDKGIQAAGAVDLPRVAEPDRQREREHGHRRDHRQPGRGAGGTGHDARRVQRGQGQRASEGRDSHAREGPYAGRPRPRGARRPASGNARGPGREGGHR